MIQKTPSKQVVRRMFKGKASSSLAKKKIEALGFPFRNR